MLEGNKISHVQIFAVFIFAYGMEHTKISTIRKFPAIRYYIELTII